MKKHLSTALLLVFMTLFVACSDSGTVQNDETTADTPTDLSEELAVHFIDVGQADAILIELPNDQNMLIDGGNRADGTTVTDYIENAGITTIDYLVGTHPHEVVVNLQFRP
jgi:competence protein ComEC